MKVEQNQTTINECLNFELDKALDFSMKNRSLRDVIDNSLDLKKSIEDYRLNSMCGGFTDYNIKNEASGLCEVQPVYQNVSNDNPEYRENDMEATNKVSDNESEILQAAWDIVEVVREYWMEECDEGSIFKFCERRADEIFELLKGLNVFVESKATEITHNFIQYTICHLDDRFNDIINRQQDGEDLELIKRRWDRISREFKYQLRKGIVDVGTNDNFSILQSAADNETPHQSVLERKVAVNPPRTIDAERLNPYFNGVFKGMGNGNINYFASMIEDLRMDRNKEEFAQIAFMIFNNKHIKTARMPNKFAPWYRIFCECIKVEPGKGIRKCGLKNPNESIKKLFGYLL